MAAKPDFIRIRKYNDDLTDYQISFGKERERPAHYKVMKHKKTEVVEIIELEKI